LCTVTTVQRFVDYKDLTLTVVDIKDSRFKAFRRFVLRVFTEAKIWRIILCGPEVERACIVGKRLYSFPRHLGVEFGVHGPEGEMSAHREMHLLGYRPVDTMVTLLISSPPPGLLIAIASRYLSNTSLDS
jgi:hypothetical protein